MENKLKSNSNAVALHEPTAQWQLIQRQCKAFMESGFLPQHIKTPAQAITIAWKGHELGIAPLVAFSSIAVIQGKPALSAELMRSLVFKKYPAARLELITPLEKQSTEATYLAQRPGGKEQFFQFTKTDAETAGLFKNNVWKLYTKAMLQARASSMACRNVFPDALMGCVYTPEELGCQDIIDVEPTDAGRVTPSQNNLEAPVDKTPTVKSTEHVNSSGNTVGYDNRKKEFDSEPATEPQGKKLFAMSKEAGYDDAQLKDLVFNVTGKESRKDLTKKDMQELYKILEEDIQIIKSSQ